jgi:hypothetical protein
MSSAMGNMLIKTGGGEDQRRKTEARSERAGKRKARDEQHRARKKAKRTNGANAPLGAHTHSTPSTPHPPREGGAAGGGGARCEGRGSSGQCRVQVRQHSGVSTARFPVSTRTLRDCLVCIGEGQLNKEPIPSRLERPVACVVLVWPEKGTKKIADVATAGEARAASECEEWRCL